MGHRRDSQDDAFGHVQLAENGRRGLRVRVRDLVRLVNTVPKARRNAIGDQEKFTADAFGERRKS